MNTDKTSLENESQPSCLGAVSGSFIQELAKEHISKCKDACYSSGSFVGRNSGNELEGDYGSWRDWEARLILFGRELLRNCR
jgi:hypothetical protein